MTTQDPDCFRSREIPIGYTFGRLPGTPHRDIVETPSTAFNSFASWRGYRAGWRLFGRILYLESLSGAYKLQTVVPVPAWWFSEWMFVDHGELVLNLFPLQPVREHCLALKFVDGRAVESADWHCADSDAGSEYDSMAKFREMVHGDA